MKKNNRRFKEPTAEKTKIAFFNFLEEKNAWFAELLYGIRHGYLRNNCAITEILIREGMRIRVSTLKSYVMCQVRTKNESGTIELFFPTGEQMLGVVDKFVEYSTKNKSKIDPLSGESIDFAFQVYGLGVFRVNFSQGNDGVSMSARYLPYDIPTLESVGYPTLYADFIKDIIQKGWSKTPPVVGDDFWISVNNADQAPMFDQPKIDLLQINVPRAGGGLVIHFGPTSSGKTTCMAAEIGYISENSSGLILTYENPIEFVHNSTESPVESFELGRDIKENEDYTLTEMVQRHALRKNPSVIMFGEMRNPAEMRMVVDFANRGHWVFASMHANSVIEGIDTLAALFKDEPYVLGNALKAAVAHRLAPTPSGAIVPLYEIFIPDEIRSAKLASGDLVEIKRAFSERIGKQTFTFDDSLELLIEKEIIKPSDKTIIRLNAIGNQKTEQE